MWLRATVKVDGFFPRGKGSSQSFWWGQNIKGETGADITHASTRRVSLSSKHRENGF